VSLSEQQITSCDRTGGDAGCAGGLSNLDTDYYVAQNGGIASEADYPLCSSKETALRLLLTTTKLENLSKMMMMMTTTLAKS
jgi:hypothetical protein